MAVFTYTDDFVLLNNRGVATAGWTGLGGGGAGLAAETDFFIEGTTCISKQVKQETKGMYYLHNILNPLIYMNGRSVYQWMFTTTAQAMDTVANNGQVLWWAWEVSGSATTMAYIVNGKDGENIDQWNCWVCSPTAVASHAVSGGTISVASEPVMLDDQIQAFDKVGGVLSNAQSVRGVNFGVDIAWLGGEFGGYGGTSPDPSATFDLIADSADDPAEKKGMFQRKGKLFSLLAKCKIGDGTNDTTFTDDGSTIFIPNRNVYQSNGGGTPATASDLSTFEIIAGTATLNATLDGTVFRSGDAHNTGVVTIGSTPTTSVTFNNCSFADWGLITNLGNTTTFNSCTFFDVGAIDNDNGSLTSGGSFNGCSFSGVAPLNTYTPSDFVDCTFDKGSSIGAPALVISAPAGSTVTLDNLTFNGYSPFNGDLESALLFNGTGTGTITVNLVGTTQPTFTSLGGLSIVFQSSTTLELTGLQNGSEVRVYDNSGQNPVEIAGGVESSTTPTLSFSISVNQVDVVIHTLDSIHIRLKDVDTTSDVSIPVEYRDDRQYENPPP